jgi:hypothetical protein
MRMRTIGEGAKLKVASAGVGSSRLSTDDLSVTAGLKQATEDTVRGR